MGAPAVSPVCFGLLTKRGRALDDILAARDHLLALPQASGAVGIGAAAKLEKVVDEKNIPADIKAYPDAGHSFANNFRRSR